MAVGPIAHGYLAFKFNALSTLSPEEETHDEKPQSKAKHFSKDYHLSHFELGSEYLTAKINAAHLHHQMHLSKGYAGIPLMPPKLG
jgi:hypothetical protein